MNAKEMKGKFINDFLPIQRFDIFDLLSNLFRSNEILETRVFLFNINSPNYLRITWAKQVQTKVWRVIITSLYFKDGIVLIVHAMHELVT